MAVTDQLPDEKGEGKIETIERWRLDVLRRGVTAALHEMSAVVLQLETGNWCDADDMYHHAVDAFAELAKALRESTQP